MKISNFKFIDSRITQNGTKLIRASVDVQTGFLKWKKKKTREIFKNGHKNWVFSDSGDYTPGYQVEKLVIVYEARNFTTI